jgi:hypothetical protein
MKTHLNGSNASLPAPVSRKRLVSIVGRGTSSSEGVLMRAISTNVRVTISVGTDRPDRVGPFALSYLSPHMSPRLLAGVEGGQKWWPAPAFANSMTVGEPLEGRESGAIVSSKTSGIEA